MEENTIEKNIENNTISIIDDSISKDKIIANNNINNNENIPIKQLKNIIFNNAEEYYSQNYPEFKLFKFCGILFCKIGNLKAFNFDKNNNFAPKYSIGPHWYMTLILHIIISMLGYTIFLFIIKNLHILFNIAFVILFFIVIIFLERAALIHPGTEISKIQDKDKYSFCNKCKIYYDPHEKVGHCSLCNVCIKKLDHHCVWVGKCVGKYNLWAFYEMIIAVGIFYIYIIICVIIYNAK